jgi:uncharacterized protein YodC (DUF2158 family)
MTNLPRELRREGDAEPAAFKPGDVVQLKSGSPALTVIATHDDGVHCLWYAELTDEMKTGVIPAIGLEKLPEEDEEEPEFDSRPPQGRKRRYDDH